MKIGNGYLELLILCSYADSQFPFLFFFTAILGFLLATLAVTSFGAPVEGIKQSILNSCGETIKAKSKTSQPVVRHGATKLMNPVKHQMAVAITHFKEKKKTIDAYYKKVSFRLK